MLKLIFILQHVVNFMTQYHISEESGNHRVYSENVHKFRLMKTTE